METYFEFTKQTQRNCKTKVTYYIKLKLQQRLRLSFVPTGEVLLPSVLHELEKVFEWFVLGPYLGVPEHELAGPSKQQQGVQAEDGEHLDETGRRIVVCSFEGTVGHRKVCSGKEDSLQVW